ncbi:HAD family hydrolase [Xanthobacter tagetidis]|jgi:hydroxymethylpyrimidine pyrophosphatase-like HAD family hydrolase|uniref:Alpha,alpha-trehalose-phosphate synthase n=1 Tax=Xanthobacter tagetidis TaxID=60216 RepID=A0A3L7A6I9_9HYPH|nr:HAD family hydrolase [Xanthobacter tagetidis]MBB6307239.1 hydroxymethylpyrimidine pyrophosphatase-like HAD family hydrolase [Xanthobacter tagetidis]RLP75787.1 alpha,alpha-trehalose-phosphate synthase [Xanthobacter tagetidis]
MGRAGARLVLATDLDGTFLGGSDLQRADLYRWIEARRAEITLVFVTGRDLPFVRALAARGVPRPDFVIGDVGTTIAGGAGLVPLAELERPIAEAWRDAGARVRELLKGEPGLTPQPTEFRYRMSYCYDPAALRPSAREKVEAAGFDCLTSADTFFDVLPRGVSKGPTLERVIRHLSIAPERVLCAGDTLNDLSLLSTPFAGVAVGNSEPALVRAVANLPDVYLSRLPGAAGIADALAHHGFMEGGAE